MLIKYWNILQSLNFELKSYIRVERLRAETLTLQNSWTALYHVLDVVIFITCCWYSCLAHWTQLFGSLLRVDLCLHWILLSLLPTFSCILWNWNFYEFLTSANKKKGWSKTWKAIKDSCGWIQWFIITSNTSRAITHTYT